MSLLEKIKTPNDLKKLSVKELPLVADEIRKKIIDVTENNGGHMASSLGAVDIIVALYYVFDFKKDRLIFDVGHQAYAHKILSERYELFDTIRTEGGLSGFPNIFESEYDAFTAGHAGTSISAQLGYCYARDAKNEDYYVISFVGDASLFNGENMEAMFSTNKKPNKMLIILNDNGMSISKNNNGLYKVVSKITMKKRYSKFMGAMDKIFGWNFIGRFLKRVKSAFKRTIDSYGFFDNLGLKYVGAFDGHNIKSLVDLFESFKHNPRATIMHIKTKKGKGFAPAEQNADLYHGVSKHLASSNNTFSQAVADIAVKSIEKNDNIVFLTAGMALGTGLKSVIEKCPKNVFDVGISEEYCVTLAAGMAMGGLKPVVCIYSTFLQRAYDQIIEDVCLQNLPVVFLIDRAGLVGSDGVTHQGVFDLSYLSHIPNMTILVPKDTAELEEMFNYSLTLNSPVAIRYPNGVCPTFETKNKFDQCNLWEEIKSGKNTTILACGPRMLDIAIKASEGKNVSIYNARSVKPLDMAVLDKISNDKIITLEENSKIGGFGSLVLNYYAKNGIKPTITILGVEDKYIDQASTASQLLKNNLTIEKLQELL